jgi:hypothetical protein
MEAGGKESNQLAGISDYIGNRREMEEWNSVPVGSQSLPPAFMPVSCSVYSSTLKMEAICSSETSVYFQRTTRLYIPEDSTLRVSLFLVFGFQEDGWSKKP